MLITQKHARYNIGNKSVKKHCFCYSNVPTTGTKKPFVSTANEALVGTLNENGWRHRYLTYNQWLCLKASLGDQLIHKRGILKVNLSLRVKELRVICEKKRENTFRVMGTLNSYLSLYKINTLGRCAQTSQIFENNFKRICIVVIFSNFFFLNRTMLCDKKLKNEDKTQQSLGIIITLSKTSYEKQFFSAELQRAKRASEARLAKNHW